MILSYTILPWAHWKKCDGNQDPASGGYKGVSGEEHAVTQSKSDKVHSSKLFFILLSLTLYGIGFA